MLSDEEKFRFDLEGYLIIPGVLSLAECAQLSELSDAVWPDSLTTKLTDCPSQFVG